MNELSGQGGELRATVTITRKATGAIEVYQLSGKTTPEEHAKIMESPPGTSGFAPIIIHGGN